MLKVYFGEWGNGRLQRLAYLGYYLLLMFLFAAIIFGAIAAVGSMENIMGGDITATQFMLTEHFGIAAIVGFALLIVAMMMAQVNILAKRIRDMGLPAVWTILCIVALSILLNILFPAQSVELNTAMIKTAEGTVASAEAHTSTSSLIVQLFDLVIFFCLLFIPSNTFHKN